MTTNQSAVENYQSFVAIDFETATPDHSSACAVAAVLFEGGVATASTSLLIRPPDNRYADYHSKIHNIFPSDTEHSPPFPEVWETISQLIDTQLVIAHNADFDISVLHKSSSHYGYSPAPFRFACTLALARSSLPGAVYTLSSLAQKFGIDLNHHDPLSDANAAGELWMALSLKFGVTPKELLDRHKCGLGLYHPNDHQPFTTHKSSTSGKSGARLVKYVSPNTQSVPKGTLAGKNIVFTRNLENTTRAEAKRLVTAAGATPTSSVTRKTDYLVVAKVPVADNGEPRLTSKHRKAQELIEAGHHIQILDSNQFGLLLQKSGVTIPNSDCL